MAIAWLLAKPYVSNVIIGANKIHQLEDNLGAADLVLDKKDVQVLDELTAPAVGSPASAPREKASLSPAHF